MDAGFILDIAREAFLVTLLVAGPPMIAGLLVGNTAERMLKRLSCAVLALKPEGFVSPVRV